MLVYFSLSSYHSETEADLFLFWLFISALILPNFSFAASFSISAFKG